MNRPVLGEKAFQDAVLDPMAGTVRDEKTLLTRPVLAFGTHGAKMLRDREILVGLRTFASGDVWISGRWVGHGVYGEFQTL